MDTPPPPPLPQPNNPVPPPVPPGLPSALPPVVPPPVTPPPVVPPPVTPQQYTGPAVTDQVMAAFKKVDWQQLGRDSKTFVKRFAAGDFAQVHPEPHELPAVAGLAPRMASLMVWRRGLLFLASVLSVVLLIKTCFDPHTFRSITMKAQMEEIAKKNPGMSPEDRRKMANEETDKAVQMFGEANAVVMDTLMVGTWLCIIASTVFQILAVMRWSDFRRSRRLALLAVSLLVLPQVVTMVFPWSALMDFSHLDKHIAQQGVPEDQRVWMKALMVGAFQGVMALSLLASALPIIYSLFTGILRGTLTAKTLIPASIVCGWSTLLLAIAISVPWFVMLCIVSQLQMDAPLVMGVICLLAAPLSLLFKCRRLGAPLRPEEASLIVKRARFLFSGLNMVGALLVLFFFVDKDWVDVGTILTMVLSYLAHLMLFTVGSVDMLALMLNRAHAKLANDECPEESLRQLGEVLPPPMAAPPIPSLV